MRLNQCSLPVSITEVDTLCQHYLSLLYSDESSKPGTVTLSQELFSETYGEILYPSINKLISSISLTEQDVFVDLGSGKGQVVIQLFLNSLVKEAYGIELILKLHDSALAAAKRLQSELPDCFHGSRKIKFLSGSFLDIPFTTATVVFINSTCFTQSLVNELGQIIENTPSIHTVLSLRAIGTLKRLIFKKAIRIECSWDSALCYIYRDAESLLT